MARRRRGFGCGRLLLGFILGLAVMAGGVAVLGQLCGGVITAECISGLVGVQQATSNPFGIADRVPPVANSPLDTVLPLTVGAFSRTQISGDLASGVRADYQGEAQVVTVLAGWPGRQAAVNYVTAAKQAFASSIESQGEGEPNFVLLSGFAGGAVRMIWNQDQYYFDVQAPSRDVLTQFMAQFPY